MLARALFLFLSALSLVSPHTVSEVDALLVDTTGHYVHVDEQGLAGLWLESNGRPGLQVRDDNGGGGVRPFASDTRLLV